MTVDHHDKIEKSASSPSSEPQGPLTNDAKEDELQAKAKAKAKARPERTANFKDYLVSTPLTAPCINDTLITSITCSGYSPTQQNGISLRMLPAFLQALEQGL